MGWFQGERPEGWHRVLDSDGGIPDDAHADERLRKVWHGLLDEDGLHAMLGMAPRSSGSPEPILAALVDNVDPDNGRSVRVGRGWCAGPMCTG